MRNANFELRISNWRHAQSVRVSCGKQESRRHPRRRLNKPHTLCRSSPAMEVGYFRLTLRLFAFRDDDPGTVRRE